MTKEESQDTTPRLEWQVETLRLTALSPSSDLGEAEDHWGQVVGGEPESTETRKGMMTKLAGPFHERQLSLIIRPDRLDWLISSLVGPESAPGVHTAGEFVATLETMKEVVAKWADWEGCPPLGRIALGAVLLSPTESRESGYRQLQPYLPKVTLDASISSDFSYQINRRRRAESLRSGLEINRLSKWSVVFFQIGALVLSGGRGKNVVGSEEHACRLELDVNTALEFEGEFPREEVPGIFDYLCALAVEISKEGDLP